MKNSVYFQQNCQSTDMKFLDKNVSITERLKTKFGTVTF